MRRTSDVRVDSVVAGPNADVVDSCHTPDVIDVSCRDGWGQRGRPQDIESVVSIQRPYAAADKVKRERGEWEEV